MAIALGADGSGKTVDQLKNLIEPFLPAGRQTGGTAANAAAAATIDIMATAAAVGASSAAASTAADTAATAAAQQQPPKEAETRTMCIMTWGTEPQEMLHPCVDCGQITGRYCDYCLAEGRVEDQEWAPGQQTPLCLSCDRTFGSCHFCREQLWARPAAWR